MAFVLASKEARLAGKLRVADSELALDLQDLTRTRGWLRIDLGSISIRGDSRDGEDAQARETAQNWLGMGRMVDEHVREKYRWARFTILQVENVRLQEADWRTRLLAKRALVSQAGGGAGAQANSDVVVTRKAVADLRGRLLLHGYEVEIGVPVALAFWGHSGPRKDPPTRIAITTRSPVPVSLLVYDIKPRDPAGNFLVRELPIVGTRIGREASVSASWIAEPTP